MVREYTKWGKWTCPVCGTNEEDPEHVTVTRCKNDHIVHLGPIGKGRIRNAVQVEQVILSEEESRDVLRLRRCIEEDKR